RRKIHRDHLQAVVGCLEAWHRETPQKRCLIIRKALSGGGGVKGFFYSLNVEVSDLRGFSRRSARLMGYAPSS
ncbi:hypothetical protein O4G98_19050, partial [Zoogloeaceae bacterium G21618-S1]|nr:hypothetical protein [Zoogloeaceae bacterium G21618-S1]